MKTEEKVLIFEKDKEWIDAVSRVLQDANIETFCVPGDFKDCYKIVREEGIPILIANIHKIDDNIREIKNFQKSFPKTHILCIFENEDPSFEAFAAFNNYIKRIGRKAYCLATDIRTQVETFFDRRGRGRIKIVFDDRIYKILKSFTITHSGEKKYRGNKLSYKLLFTELESIIRAIFLESSGECPITTSIRVEPFVGDDGHSGSSLLKITPAIILKTDSKKSAVLKFGGLNEIRKESKNYDKYVEWFLTVEQTVRKISYKEENHTAGILYSYPRDRVGAFRHFAEFIRNEPINRSINIISKIFDIDNKHWLAVNGDTYIDQDKRRFQTYYMLDVLGCDLYELKNIHLKALRNEISNYQKKNKKNVWDRKKEYTIFSDLNIKVPDPILFMEKPIVYPLHFTIVHGDLHGYNLLVDQDDEYCFIDFFHTGFGHIYRDFIELELSVRYDLFCSKKITVNNRLIAKEPNSINTVGLKKLIGLEKALIKSSIKDKEPKESFLNQPNKSYNKELKKAYDIIKCIRDCAAANFKDEMEYYYKGLVASSLRALKYPYYLDIKIYRYIIAGLYIQALK